MVLEAAQQMQGARRPLLVCERGAQKAELLAQRNKMGLTNVTMLAEQPWSRIPAFLSAADVALVPLRTLEHIEGAVPSKLFDVRACGRPVILGIEGEAR